ncbi:MAG TPA: methionine--tRNA ligase subunit beta [Dehalococcoidia bacterium]|nr:methionine--tRNA ligase subunit beta [Dehalococcoidia bacterium]
MISLDEFRTLDLRVAQVTSAEKIPKTDRLLKVTVDLGDQDRTLVAGLGGHYTPGQLVGLKVIVVANLEPATIRGIESNGMMLGAGCTDRDDIALLTVNRGVPNGTRVE